jgi:hypothetical protein
MASRELAFLRIVADKTGEVGWHAIETQMSRLDVPFQPSAVELGRRLEAVGMTRLVERAGFTHGAYEITDLGRTFVRDAERNTWPLGPTEAAELAHALSRPLSEAIAAFAPMMADAARCARALQQLLVAGLANDAIAYLSQLLLAPERWSVGVAFATDSRPEVRLALFRAWGGPGEGIDAQARFKPPGPVLEWHSDWTFVELLQIGLADPAVEVRDAAARLAYATQSGALVATELLADLASPQPSVWSAAALGPARDPASLAILRALVRGGDEAFAAAAVRALAGRPDGHGDLVAAARDARTHVRWVAAMSFGMIALGMSADDLAAITRDPTPDLNTALSYYRSRNP